VFEDLRFYREFLLCEVDFRDGSASKQSFVLKLEPKDFV
jgi:hypothetical protein